MWLERPRIRTGAPLADVPVEPSGGAARCVAPVPALLIDDLDETAAYLSPLGRLLLSDALVNLRRTLNHHASSNGWRVMSYASFVNWSVQVTDAALVLVADKLYPTSRLCRAAVRVDAHRWWAGKAAEREVSIQAVSIKAPRQCRIAVIDDATWSGDTLRDLCRRVNAAGGTVSHIVVGAASPCSAEMLRATGARISVFAKVPTDWDIQHARDFCPWLPYSGRRIRSKMGVLATGIDVRLAPLFYNVGAWLQLTPDCHCWSEATELALGFIARLEAHLGRRALVQDLALLGPEASLPIRSPESAEQNGILNAPLWDFLGARERLGT